MDSEKLKQAYKDAADRLVKVCGFAHWQTEHTFRAGAFWAEQQLVGGYRKELPTQAESVVDALKAEAAKLAPILSAMLEGGSVDDATDIYADDYEAPDGDVFVYRAAQLLETFATAPQATQPQAPAAPASKRIGQIVNPASEQSQDMGTVVVAEIMSNGYNGQVLWKGTVPPVGTLLYASPQAATAQVPAVDAETIHLQDLKNAIADCNELRQQLTLMDEQQAGSVWRWQADGQDQLETMGNNMGVLIRACDLRALLTDCRLCMTILAHRLTDLTRET